MYYSLCTVYIICSFLITVLAVELAKELEEYGLKCSVPKYEEKVDNDAESDGVSLEVRVSILHST